MWANHVVAPLSMKPFQFPIIIQNAALRRAFVGFCGFCLPTVDLATVVHLTPGL